MIELLTIGDELLLGSTVDTNAAFLGTRLTAAGFRVLRLTTVGDREPEIRDALLSALRRTGCVICTGGLGPTPDDLTRPVVAALYGRELLLDEHWLAELEGRFQARGMAMPANNRQQALVPDCAVLLPNQRGTAPGLALSDPALGTTVLLPGVPAEMRSLLEAQVLPYLAVQFGPRPPVRSRTLRTTGMAESALAERLAGVGDDLSHLTLAYLPTGTGIDLRLTTWGELEEPDAERVLAEGEQRLRQAVGDLIYGTGNEDLAAVLGVHLGRRQLRLAVAESCTGGLLAARITAVPGSSDYFLGGVVAYANSAKQALLGVADATLGQYGAVSEKVALELARGAVQSTGADCGLAITGIAGPAGGTPDRPVGTVWIAMQVPGESRAERFRFAGSRDEIRARAAQAALALLLRALR
ncbi:MAG: competence/damage-inducible protein A [Gemmatimonadetes bacterium]|nr:competence/damage-inducible protein A [Gemmatimonadota bacterium]